MASLIPSLYDFDPFEHRLRRRLRDWDTSRSLIDEFYPSSKIVTRYHNLGSEVGQSKVEKDGFTVCVDVQQFKPEEIKVKTVDNFVIVEAKHEERQDEQGFISRQFVRKYNLPKGVNTNDVISTLSSDGVLTIKIIPPKPVPESNERVVQIQQTGPAKETPSTTDK